MAGFRTVRSWVVTRPIALGSLGAVGAAVLLGVPTDVISNPWFERKVPTRSFEVVTLVALAVIAGLVAATYAQPADHERGTGRVGMASGVVGWFAVSCPLCNPFVVGLLGASGATGVFARLQPALAVLAIALGAGAFALRVRTIRQGTCPVPPRETTAAASS